MDAIAQPFRTVRLTTATQMAVLSLNTVNFAVTSGNLYDAEALSDLSVIADSFNSLAADPRPGNRRRAHSKLLLTQADTLIVCEFSAYAQANNYDAPNELREFSPIEGPVLITVALRHLILRHAMIARLCRPGYFIGDLHVGLHTIRYECVGLGVSFSSPIGPHSDDEPYVVVILIDRVGIDADTNYVVPGKWDGKEKPSVALKLHSPLDALILGERCAHGVNIMSSTDGYPAYRDILIITFTPVKSA